jgi:CRISPR-associated protein Cmr1
MKFDLEKKHNGITTEVRRYRLITPLFGGGVEPGWHDPVSVVRATSIRGQLRFWWRAICGGRYASLPELYRAEGELWGSAARDKDDNSGPGLVQVEVIPLQPRKKDDERLHDVYTTDKGRKRARPRRNTRVHPYVSFPLQPSQEEAEHISENEIKRVRHDVEFDLRLSYPQGNDAVEAALWAWETFGGVGGRTRRGFGAIALIARGKDANSVQPVAPPALQTVEQQLRGQLAAHLTKARHIHNDIPHLQADAQWLRVVNRRWNLRPRDRAQLTQAQAAWHELIAQLQHYRQQRDPAPGKSEPPGRSRWPESDSLRLDLQTHLPAHPPRLRFRKYPRAEFGLPIITKFKDEGRGGQKGDPQQSTLQGIGYDRMASPLILRPLLCQHNGLEVAVGLALVLGGQRLPPGGLELKHGQRATNVNANRLTSAEASQIVTNPGNQPIIRNAEQPDGTVDILLGFLNTLQEQAQ